MKTLIYNANLVMPDRIIEKGYLVFEDSVIADFGEGCPLHEGEIIDAHGLYLSAGFVDIHCHGGGDCDFNDGGSKSYVIPATLHAKHGTTSLVPTITTGPKEDLEDAFISFFKAKECEYNGARLLGIHMEGPYISPAQAGAQDVRYIKIPKKEDYSSIIEKSDGAIIRWTFAPEIEGAKEFQEFLKSKGIISSIGHSNALYSHVKEAYENGARLLTHFYSGMSTITRVDGYRKPGVVESGYLIDDMNIEVIADGHHLPKELLEMIYKFKSSKCIALVTDAMRGAGMPEGDTVLGNRKTGLHCIIEDGVAKLPDRSAFAGSVCTTNRLVRTMYKDVGVPLCEAIKMMTYNPASFIGFENKIGNIKKGLFADLVLFDDNINIERTIVGGKTVYQRSFYEKS